MFISKICESRLKYIFAKGWYLEVLPAMYFHAIDDDECQDNTHVCHSVAVCVNTKGSYNCTCNNGYEGDGYNCSGKKCRPFVF